MLTIQVPIQFLAWLIFIYMLLEAILAWVLAIGFPNYQSKSDRGGKVVHGLLSALILYLYWIVWHS